MSVQKKPMVSVVVCAYNEEKLLGKCLAGLAAQTYPRERFEVLIIDDESTDGTFAIASAFIEGLSDDALAVRLFRVRHGGLSVARNSGIQLSKGEIIAFIDGDAVADPTWLEALVQPFLAGADYVGGRIDLLNTESWVARFLQRTRHRQFFGPRIFNDQCIGCNMAFRREVFDAVGGFHENFVSRGDESTLQERISGRFQFAAAPDAVVLHERPDTVSAALRVTWKSATLSHLCARAAGRKMQGKSMLLLLEQFLITLFPVLLGIVWLRPSLFLLPLAVATLAVVRRLYLRPLNRAIAAGLIQEYGLVRGTIGHVVFVFTYSILGWLGWLLSPWMHRRAEIVPPRTTPLTVLKSLHTDNGQ